MAGRGSGCIAAEDCCRVLQHRNTHIVPLATCRLGVPGSSSDHASSQTFEQYCADLVHRGKVCTQVTWRNGITGNGGVCRAGCSLHRFGRSPDGTGGAMWQPASYLPAAAAVDDDELLDCCWPPRPPPRPPPGKAAPGRRHSAQSDEPSFQAPHGHVAFVMKQGIWLVSRNRALKHSRRRQTACGLEDTIAARLPAYPSQRTQRNCWRRQQHRRPPPQSKTRSSSTGCCGRGRGRRRGRHGPRRRGGPGADARCLQCAAL